MKKSGYVTYYDFYINEIINYFFLKTKTLKIIFLLKCRNMNIVNIKKQKKCET